jgi:hypothetical protein
MSDRPTGMPCGFMAFGVYQLVSQLVSQLWNIGRIH